MHLHLDITQLTTQIYLCGQLTRNRTNPKLARNNIFEFTRNLEHTFPNKYLIFGFNTVNPKTVVFTPSFSIQTAINMGKCIKAWLSLNNDHVVFIEIGCIDGDLNCVYFMICGSLSVVLGESIYPIFVNIQTLRPILVSNDLLRYLFYFDYFYSNRAKVFDKLKNKSGSITHSNLLNNANSGNIKNMGAMQNANKLKNENYQTFKSTKASQISDSLPPVPRHKLQKLISDSLFTIQKIHSSTPSKNRTYQFKQIIISKPNHKIKPKFKAIANGKPQKIQEIKALIDSDFILTTFSEIHVTGDICVYLQDGNRNILSIYFNTFFLEEGLFRFFVNSFLVDIVLIDKKDTDFKYDFDTQQYTCLNILIMHLSFDFDAALFKKLVMDGFDRLIVKVLLKVGVDEERIRSIAKKESAIGRRMHNNKLDIYKETGIPSKEMANHKKAGNEKRTNKNKNKMSFYKMKNETNFSQIDSKIFSKVENTFNEKQIPKLVISNPESPKKSFFERPVYETDNFFYQLDLLKTILQPKEKVKTPLRKLPPRKVSFKTNSLEVRKPLYWQTLPNVANTLFSELDHIKFVFDCKKFEEWFCEPRTDVIKKKKKRVALLNDDKRLFLISISLKCLEKTGVDIRNLSGYVYEFNKEMSFEDLMNVKRVLPSEEECVMIEKFVRENKELIRKSFNGKNENDNNDGELNKHNNGKHKNSYEEKRNDVNSEKKQENYKNKFSQNVNEKDKIKLKHENFFDRQCNDKKQKESNSLKTDDVFLLNEICNNSKYFDGNSSSDKKFDFMKCKNNNSKTYDKQNNNKITYNKNNDQVVNNDRSIKEDISLLSDVEIFLILNKDCRQLKSILNLLIFERRILEMSHNQNDQIDKLIKLFEYIIDSKMIKILLKGVLEVGNLVNCSYSKNISKKKALGFKITSLKNFIGYKTDFKGKNLISYLYEALMDSFCNISDILNITGEKISKNNTNDNSAKNFSKDKKELSKKGLLSGFINTTSNEEENSNVIKTLDKKGYTAKNIMFKSKDTNTSLKNDQTEVLVINKFTTNNIEKNFTKKNDVIDDFTLAKPDKTHIEQTINTSTEFKTKNLQQNEKEDNQNKNNLIQDFNEKMSLKPTDNITDNRPYPNLPKNQKPVTSPKYCSTRFFSDIDTLLNLHLTIKSMDLDALKDYLNEYITDYNKCYESVKKIDSKECISQDLINFMGFAYNLLKYFMEKYRKLIMLSFVLKRKFGSDEEIGEIVGSLVEFLNAFKDHHLKIKETLI